MAPLRWRKSLLSVTRRLVRRSVRADPRLRLESIGSDYGGWIIPTNLVRPNWLCYCGGVGEDITFDLGMIERFGVNVFAFDPTPRAIAHVEREAGTEPRFHFMPVGLWDENATLRFFVPQNPAHVSHSVVNLQRTTEFFEAPCRTLASLMAELGHEQIDLVKLDIEGAEHRVIASMLDARIRPIVLCTEIDQPVGAFRFLRTMRRVRRAGYTLVAVKDWNFTFVRNDAIANFAGGAMPVSVRADPRITFGVIVLNGEPFTRYTLRSLYPFAHQIIVAEGAAPAARNIATPDGHSRDGTLEALRRFIAEEDPEGKVTLVTAEDEGHPNGFWPGEKDEQSRAYASRATGDYLWQVDIDEFYRAEDMARIIDMLRENPSITAMTFKQLTFWGGLDYIADGWYLRRGATYYHRLFRWGPGYTYSTHRPPTVRDPEGRDLRSLHWVRGEALAALGIHLYHYSLLLPKQVIEKCDYYGNAAWAARPGAVAWAQESFLRLRRPFRVHNVYQHPSWLERYAGPHPEQAARMVADLKAAGGEIQLRPTDDIERLLASPLYRLGRALLRRADPIERRGRRVARRVIRRFRGGRR